MTIIRSGLHKDETPETLDYSNIISIMEDLFFYRLCEEDDPEYESFVSYTLLSYGECFVDAIKTRSPMMRTRKDYDCSEGVKAQNSTWLAGAFSKDMKDEKQERIFEFKEELLNSGIFIEGEKRTIVTRLVGE